MPENIPKVILPPVARGLLQDGFDQIARLLALTLGPSQGIVFNSTALKPAPEPITDAATIARRITQMPNRGQDVGAMLLRSLVWRVHQRVGDGSATTAVLAQTMLAQANRFVAAGANPVKIQQGIHQATLRAISALKELASPVTCQEQLAAVAYTATGEPELSFILSELFDLLGEHAHVIIEDYMAPYLEREYINGGQWQAKLISPYLISSPTGGKAIAPDANVVLFNGNITDSEDILHIIRLLSQQEQKSTLTSKNLLLVANKISGEALNTLVATYVQNKKELQFVPVDLVRAGEKARNDLQDLAFLTGARLLDPEAGDRLKTLSISYVGKAQRAEASSENLVVMGGKGDPAELRDHINNLNKYLDRLAFDDSQVDEVKMRLGRLSGSSGILKIGAYTQNERQIMHQKAQQGLQTLHAAIKAGVLPGGGTAYLHCIPLIDRLTSTDEDVRMGYHAVTRALKRPFVQLLKNAGISDSGSLAYDIANAEPGLVFDLQEKKIHPALEAGVLDAALVLCTSLETAASGARMALSTDVILLKRNPRLSYEP